MIAVSNASSSLPIQGVFPCATITLNFRGSMYSRRGEELSATALFTRRLNYGPVLGHLQLAVISTEARSRRRSA